MVLVKVLAASNAPSQQSAAKKWALGAVAAVTAESVTFPLDVTKTRLQLQHELGQAVSPATAQRRGLVGMAVHVVRTEGIGAMYKGLGAANLRQAVYGGIGIGLYPYVRNLVTGGRPDEAHLGHRLAAGMLTGAVGQLVASPTDVVKVRLQADGRLKLLGEQPRYTGVPNAFAQILKQEGPAGFFRGLAPSLQRAAVINGAGLASYDQSKRIATAITGRDEGLPSHLVGALVSGLASATVSSPFDVVKTRLMNQKQTGERMYSGTVDCLAKTVRAEGFFALYKGFSAAYARLAPWQLVGFLVLEQITKLTTGHSY